MKLKINQIERYPEQVIWSGCYNSVIRTVTASVLDDEKAFALGDTVELLDDEGKRLFLGTVTERQRADNDRMISVSAEDRGIYLKRNSGHYAFAGQTPKAVVQKLAADYGITLGAVADPSYKLTRNFYGVDLYNIIMTAYTLAADGKKFYYPYFDGDGKLCVAQLKEGNEDTLSHYVSASHKESMRNMVNRVSVYDSDNKKIATYDEAADLAKYGQFSQILKIGEDEDPKTGANKLLHGIDQSVKLKGAIGNTGYITGKGIIVPSPLEAVNGLFWITSDTHRWNASGYTVDLELSFEKIMNETVSGTDAEKKGGSKNGVGKSSGSAESDEIAAKIAAWKDRRS